MNVFRKSYRPLTEEESNLIKAIKDHAEVMFDLIERMKQGRYSALAKTSLEESVMWAVKGISE